MEAALRFAPDSVNSFKHHCCLLDTADHPLTHSISTLLMHTGDESLSSIKNTTGSIVLLMRSRARVCGHMQNVDVYFLFF